MLRDQLMHIFPDRFKQLPGICTVLVQDLLQNRIINKLRDAQLSGIAVHKVRDINHHVGEHLYISLLRLDPHSRYRGILDRICQFSRHLVARLRQDLTCLGIHHVLRQDMMSDPVAEHKLFIKFISADLGQIISSGIKEHRHDQAFRTLHTERLARADLFIQLKQTLLIILRSVLCKTRLDLRLITEKLPDLIVGAHAKRTDQHSDRNLSGSVHAHVEDIIRVCLIL